MPPRVVNKKAGTTAQKKTAAKVPSKFPKTPAKPVSSTPGKPEAEAVEKAESKPSPTVEAPKAREKAVEQFQDLKEPSIEVKTEKDIPSEDANIEIKEFFADSDKHSAERNEEGVKWVDLKNKETDAVMHEAHDHEGNDKEHQNDLAEINVVLGEQSHGDEAADGAVCHEEGVEGDGGDEQHDMEMPALVKERIKQNECEVFVGGLDKDADEEDLKKAFSEVGDVLEIRLPKNIQSQKNRGFGFVRFATVEQVKRVLAELKNPEVRGKQCGVTRNKGNETLHLLNICKSWTKETLEKKLKEYGLENIEEINLVKDPQNEGTNKGFAYLEFPTRLEATSAFKRLKKRDVFFGVDICAKVAFANSGIEPEDEEVMAQVKSVFVDGLPPSWDEERVQGKFKKYGEIEKVELARNIVRAKRNDFGFISFTTREAALACIEGVNKNEVNDEDKKVTLRATLRKPQDNGTRDNRSRVHQGRRRLLDKRHQQFGSAYDRPHGHASVRSDSMRNYRDEDSYVDRRARPPARSVGTITRRSSYRDDYGYHGAEYCESMPAHRPPYSEDSYSHRMNGMSAYNDRPVRDYAGVSGSKRPFSDVDDVLPYPGGQSRSRLDYDAGVADSRYGGSFRLGQDPQLGYGFGSRAGAIYPSDYLSSGDTVGGPYPSVLAWNATRVYGRGNGSASYY